MSQRAVGRVSVSVFLAIVLVVSPVSAVAEADLGKRGGVNVPEWPVVEREVELPLGARHFGGPAWSPDGKQLAFVEFRFLRPANDPSGLSERDRIWIIDSVTGADGSERLIGELPLPGIAGHLMWPAAGNYLYLVRARVGAPGLKLHGSLYRLRISDGAFGEILRWPSSKTVGGAAMCPDGRYVAMDFAGTLQILDLATRKTKTIYKWIPHGGGGVTWSPDGKTIAFVGPSHQVCTISPDGKGLRTLCPGAYPRWSPDGGWILFNRETVEGRTPSGLAISPRGHAWVVHPDGTGEHELAPGVSESELPVWSPTGDRILYRHSEFFPPPGRTRWYVAVVRSSPAMR